jgi:hypothetical protein
MPCMDGREREGQEHANEAARILCELVGKGNPQDLFNACKGHELHNRLKAWAEKHREIDSVLIRN